MSNRYQKLAANDQRQIKKKQNIQIQLNEQSKLDQYKFKMDNSNQQDFNSQRQQQKNQEEEDQKNQFDKKETKGVDIRLQTISALLHQLEAQKERFDDLTIKEQASSECKVAGFKTFDGQRKPYLIWHPSLLQYQRLSPANKKIFDKISEQHLNQEEVRLFNWFTFTNEETDFLLELLLSSKQPTIDFCENTSQNIKNDLSLDQLESKKDVTQNIIPEPTKEHKPNNSVNIQHVPQADASEPQTQKVDSNLKMLIDHNNQNSTFIKGENKVFQQANEQQCQQQVVFQQQNMHQHSNSWVDAKQFDAQTQKILNIQPLIPWFCHLQQQIALTQLSQQQLIQHQQQQNLNNQQKLPQSTQANALQQDNNYQKGKCNKKNKKAREKQAEKIKNLQQQLNQNLKIKTEVKQETQIISDSDSDSD